MLRIADYHLVLPGPTMGTSPALGVIPNHFTVLPIYVGTILFITTTPATKTNHQIVFLPFPKRIIGCVNHHQVSALLDVFHESLLGLLLPRLAVVIRENHIIGRKIDNPVNHIGLGDCFGMNTKLTTSLERRFHHRRTTSPVVIVLAVNKQNLKLVPASVMVGSCNARIHEEQQSCCCTKQF